MAKIHLKIDDPNHTFIIAEAGSNWKSGSYEEDLEQAKKLIKIASNSGADAVKFQTYRADTVYAYNAGNSNYLAEQGINPTKHAREIVKQRKFQGKLQGIEVMIEFTETCNYSSQILRPKLEEFWEEFFILTGAEVSFDYL